VGRPVPAIEPAALDGAALLESLGLGAGTVEVERVRRGVLRYAWAGGALIGKVYESAEAARAGFGSLRALWESGFCDAAPPGVRIPEPYACLPELRLVAMEHVPGRSLKRLVRRRQAGAAELELLAEALAKLHRWRQVTSRRVALEEHLGERCAALVPSLVEAFPELVDPVQRILERAQAAEAQAVFSLAHGDCHLGQVRVEGGRLWILDLDPLHVGDPAYDLAMVCRQLPQGILRDAFLGAYSRRGDASALARIPVHAALIHLKRACKRFRWRDEPGWPESVRREVREGSAWIAG
jgi:aminoglycoside phosphotransferase (APT) family kinase protein